MIRVYQDQELIIGNKISLNEKASHHLAHVLRISNGENIIVFNGKGGEYQASVTSINKRGIEIEIKYFIERDCESPLHLILGQGISRGDKMDFVIQKAVELGVNKIFPLVTERCNVRLNADQVEKKLNHWCSVAQSACEQSGRNILPEIMTPMNLAEWLHSTNADLSFVLSPYADASLDKEQNNVSSIQVLIGPEGGLSEQEIKLAELNKFKPLSLGPRILRTETATLAALSVLQREFGDFN